MPRNSELSQFINQIHLKKLSIDDATAANFGRFCLEGRPKEKIPRCPRGFLTRLALACQYLSAENFTLALEQIVSHTKQQLEGSPYVALIDEPMIHSLSDNGVDYYKSGSRSSSWVYNRLLSMGLPEADLVITPNDKFLGKSAVNDPRVSTHPTYFFDDWALTGLQVEEALSVLEDKGNVHVSLVRASTYGRKVAERLTNVVEVYAVPPQLERLDKNLLSEDINFLGELFWNSEGDRTPSSVGEIGASVCVFSPFKIPDCVPEVLLGTRVLPSGEPMPLLIQEVIPPYATDRYFY